MFLSITDIFVKLFSMMMYGLSQAFLWILYWIEKVFKILAGVEPIPGSNQSTSSILDQIFGIYESSNGTNLNQNGGIQIENSTTIKLFGFFLLIGLCVFVICLLAGVVRAWIKKDTPGEMKKCLSSSFKAVFYFVFIPTFFVISVFLLSRVFYIVTNYLSVTITGNNLEYGTTESTSIANTLWQRMFDAQDRKTLTENHLNFTNTYDEISGAVSLKMGETSYKYVIVIIVTAIMFWTMGIATIGLAERLINIVFLYLVSPIMIGASPLDSGERLNLWKDKVIVKFFGVMGNILSMYIFLLILGIVGNIVDNYHGDDKGYWVLTAVFAIVCIAGAMMCCKGQTLLAGLISHAQANEEGLSSMATSQLAGKGLSIAKTGIGAAAGGAFMGTKALANKGLGISNPSISQVGKSGGAMAGATLNRASASGGALNSALQSKGASASGGAMAGATGSAGTGLLNSASQGGGASKLNKGLQATAGGLRKVPVVGGLLATGLGLGAAAVKGTGKLLSAPSNIKANRAYKKNANTVRDKDGNVVMGGKHNNKPVMLKRGDANRMTYKEAKLARAQENLAKNQEKASFKLNAKQHHQQSIMQQAQKNGRGQARQAMSQKADSILAKKAPDLMNNKNNNSQRREAKKGIIQAMEQGYTGKALKQKIDDAIKNSNKPQNSSGGSNSALAKVGKDGGKK